MFLMVYCMLDFRKDLEGSCDSLSRCGIGRTLNGCRVARCVVRQGRQGGESLQCLYSCLKYPNLHTCMIAGMHHKTREWALGKQYSRISLVYYPTCRFDGGKMKN